MTLRRPLLFCTYATKMSFLQELWNFMKKSTKSKHDRLNSKAMDRNKKVERWNEDHPITSADYTQYRWRTVNKGKKFKLSKKDGQKTEKDNATGHQCEGGCSCQLVKEFTRAKERGDVEAMERIKEGKFVPDNHYHTKVDTNKRDTTTERPQFDSEKDIPKHNTTAEIRHCDQNQDTTKQTTTAEISHYETKWNSIKRDTLVEHNPVDNTQSNKTVENETVGNKSDNNVQQNELEKETDLRDNVYRKSKKNKRKGKKKARLHAEDTANNVQDISRTQLSNDNDSNVFL